MSETRKCQTCGKSMEGWLDGKYCSMKCAVEAYRKNRRPKEKKQDV